MVHLKCRQSPLEKLIARGELDKRSDTHTLKRMIVAAEIWKTCALIKFTGYSPTAIRYSPRVSTSISKEFFDQKVVQRIYLSQRSEKYRQRIGVEGQRILDAFLIEELTAEEVASKLWADDSRGATDAVRDRFRAFLQAFAGICGLPGA